MDYPKINLFEAINSLRAVRNFDGKPVEKPIIKKILEAATKAPTGSRREQWEFMVITDSNLKKEIAELYTIGFIEYLENHIEKEKISEENIEAQRQMVNNTPVLIFPCVNWNKTALTVQGNNSYIGKMTQYGSVFPALQNILLASRGFGVGTTITTIGLAKQIKVKELLSVPEHVDLVAMILMGYPKKKPLNMLRPPKRQNAELFTHWNSW